MKKINEEIIKACELNLGGTIISLIKYWNQVKYKDNLDIIHAIIPSNVNSLSMQLTTEFKFSANRGGG
jgi:hypothetical protein